jgi:hypothetical protein
VVLGVTSIALPSGFGSYASGFQRCSCGLVCLPTAVPCLSLPFRLFFVRVIALALQVRGFDLLGW